MPSSAQARVVIVGAGPAGIAAAARLRERAEEALQIDVVTRDGVARHLPGVLGVALGEREVEEFEVAVSLPGVRVVAAEATDAGPSAVACDGGVVHADAVIAAPGLELAFERVPSWPRARVAWDLSSARAAAGALAAVPGGRVVIGICALPYRCPPAPYSLAMQLADAYRRSGRFTRVCVATPEPLPLVGVGGEAPGYLLEACAGAEVEVERRFEIDLEASEDGLLRARDGRELDYELALLIPPHRCSRALERLPGDGALVEVDERGETGEPGLFVAGDAAASPLPRAAGVAEAQGRTAADAALARLGMAEPEPPHTPEPSCFLFHGRGAISRIRLRYPPGPSPAGEPEVSIEGPSPDLAYALEGERRRFLRSASSGGAGGPAPHRSGRPGDSSTA